MISEDSHNTCLVTLLPVKTIDFVAYDDEDECLSVWVGVDQIS